MNREEIKLKGYGWEQLPSKYLKQVDRMDFLNKEGELLPNLPADPYHLKRWKARGFTPVTSKDTTVEEKPSLDAVLEATRE